MTVVILLDIQSLALMQKTPDQEPYLCNMLYEVSVVSLTACGEDTNSIPTQTDLLSALIFFERKCFTHHIQITQEAQQWCFIALEKDNRFDKIFP